MPESMHFSFLFASHVKDDCIEFAIFHGELNLYVDFDFGNVLLITSYYYQLLLCLRETCFCKLKQNIYVFCLQV